MELAEDRVQLQALVLAVLSLLVLLPEILLIGANIFRRLEDCKLLPKGTASM
jgi:hypothetical protein